MSEANPDLRTGVIERCTARRPCRVCTAPQWCQHIGDSVAQCMKVADGAYKSVAQCMKVADGAYKSVEQADGSVAHFHRLTPAEPRDPIPAAPPADRADAGLRHRVYESLLNMLGLSLNSSRRAALRRRGFSDADINRLRYSDYTASAKRWDIARSLARRFGTAVLAVPGVVVRDRGKGPYVTLAGAEGLAIPIRDRASRIVAMKVRRDDAAVAADPKHKGKYAYLTSHSDAWAGPKADDAVHVPLGTDLSGPVLRVTERPFKADLCAVRTDVPTVAMPSAGAWKCVAELLRELPHVRRVQLAPDADFRTNPQVARGLARLAGAARELGREVRLEVWDGERAKGIDDAINAGLTTDLFDPDESQAAIDAAAVATLGSVEATEGEPRTRLRPLRKAIDDPCELARRFVDERHRLPGRGPVTLRYHREDWHRWDGAAWPVMPTDEVRSEVVACVEGYLDLASRSLPVDPDKPPPTAPKVGVRLVNDIMQALTAQTIIPHTVVAPAWLDGRDELDLRVCLFARNGVVDLAALTAGRSDFLTPPTPHLFNTTALPFDFDLATSEPCEWLRFLDGLWPDDPDSVALLQEWFGYAITPDTRLQKIMLIVGPGRSGKGTIARLLTALVGRENTAAPTLGSLGERFGLWPLVGKALAVVGDAHLSGRSDAVVITERLKSISGEDLLLARDYLTRIPAYIRSRTNRRGAGA